MTRLTQAGHVDRRYLGRPGRTEPTARESQMIAMRQRGDSLESIGAHFGVTRERVRQLLTRFGSAGDRGMVFDGEGLDIIGLLRTIRSTPTIESLNDVVDGGWRGRRYASARKELIALGLWKPIQRLFRFRASRRRREAIRVAVRAFIAQHGRVPYGFEMGTSGPELKDPSLPYATVITREWHGMNRFWADLGVESRLVGGNGHRIPTKPYRSRARQRRR